MSSCKFFQIFNNILKIIATAVKIAIDKTELFWNYLICDWNIK